MFQWYFCYPSILTEPEEEIIAEDYSGEMENEPPEEEELQILLNNTGLPMGWWKVKDPKR